MPLGKMEYEAFLENWRKALTQEKILPDGKRSERGLLNPIWELKKTGENFMGSWKLMLRFMQWYIYFKIARKIEEPQKNSMLFPEGLR